MLLHTYIHKHVLHTPPPLNALTDSIGCHLPREADGPLGAPCSLLLMGRVVRVHGSVRVVSEQAPGSLTTVEPVGGRRSPLAGGVTTNVCVVRGSNELVGGWVGFGE